MYGLGTRHHEAALIPLSYKYMYLYPPVLVAGMINTFLFV